METGILDFWMGSRMEQSSDRRTAFEAEVTERFGILPNFFRSASAAPELIQKLWSFAKSGYIDNPIPALFKERLFVTLSRLCQCAIASCATSAFFSATAGRQATHAHPHMGLSMLSGS